MPNYAKLAKGLTSAIKGTQDVLPAAERQANLAKMLEQSVVKDRLYHGTKSPIKSFDLSKRGSSDVSSVGGGIYLTPDPNVASFYSKIVPGESGSNVMPVHAQVKNPFEYDLAMPFKSQKESNEFSRRLQEAGYDSIIKRGKDGEIVELVVFEPNKIKSAIGNKGTYDVTKPDINEAKGGSVKMAAGGVSKAAKAITSLLKGTQDVLPAAEREANLAKFLEQSKTPMRLYHGTTATEAGKGAEAISRLKPSKEGSLGSGVYLTPKPEFAGQYASTAGGNVLPVHAQLRNPLIIEGKHGDPMIEALMKLGMDENKASKMVERAYENKGYIGKEVENRARAAGYDGLMQYRNGELSEVVSYNPNAVKSAIGNKGTYDVYNQDLNQAKGGSVKMAAGGLGALAKLGKALSKADDTPKARGFSEKVLQSTTNKMLDELMAANPKLTPEEALKKARAQAEKKLAWETEQKPALVKEYGPLARASYAKSNPEKMQNTPEMVRQRIARANAFLDQPTEAWVPPKPELQAFDRAAIKDALEGFPGVEQTAFPRDIPARASTSHVEELYTDPVNRELIKKQIARGLPLGGESFYASLYPIKQAVLEAGMPAEKFDKWIHSLAPASARNSIMNEMASGQFLRDMNARGIPLTEENVAREMAAFKQKYGIGLPLMPIHRQGVANVLEGGQDLREMSKANIPTNYKIPTYGTQKAGDFGKSVVLDVHEAAGQTQGSRFHPYFKEQGGFGNTEYNAGEQGLLGIAQEMGIPGGMAQAGRWFGGGELTGLRSPRGDALDLLEKQVAYTLKQQGKQPNPAMIRQEILRQIETGEGTLLPWFKKEGMPDVRETGLQRKDGGEVSSDSFASRLKSALEQHMAEGGEVSENTVPDMTDGGEISYAQGYDNGGTVEPLSAPDSAPSAETQGMVDRVRQMLKSQIAKEGAVLSTPEGRKDLALKVASHLPGLGMGGDLVSLVDFVQSLIPGLNKPASVMGQLPDGEMVPKFPLASIIKSPTGEEFQEKFKSIGWQKENEAPISEIIASFLTPGAVAKAPRAIEGGLNAVTAAARRPLTPATVTTEAVAPDLAKFKNRAFQDYVTKQMIGEGAAVPMTTMGGRATTQRPGQGVYLNEAGQLELNPMVGVDVPRAGNLGKNKALRADIATAGQELNQEAMAAHRFVPMATNQIKDASSMMITGPGGRALTNQEVIDLGKRLPGMIVTHSPRSGGVFVAPFSREKGKIPPEFLEAQAVAGQVLGKNAKIQFGKSDPNKDLMYMMRSDYPAEGGRGVTEQAQSIRNALKGMDQSFPARR